MNLQERFTVLIVEDDRSTSDFLAENLIADGYSLLMADTAAKGQRQFERKYPDLAIVDVGLPDGTGLELISWIREADGAIHSIDPRVPIIILSGRSSELDIIRGFERGCDDYVIKPFAYSELRVRIKALLIRSDYRMQRGRRHIGGLLFDPVSRTVKVGSRLINLSPKEFMLLRTLAMDPDRVFSKDELMRRVWGHGRKGTSRTLDSHACRLRRKLAVSSNRRVYVVNIWGVGYRLTNEGAK